MPKYIVVHPENTQPTLPANTPTIILQGKPVSLNQTIIEIWFVFDTTGSMSAIIEALLAMCISFLTEPARYSFAAHFALVSFGDLLVSGDKIKVEVSLTADVEVMKTGLRNITRNGGGGNAGESSFEAIQTALRASSESSGKSIKAMVLITDEPAHQYALKSHQIHQMIQSAGFLFFALSPRYDYFVDLATKNGGEWEAISGASNLEMLKKLFQSLATKIATTSNAVKLTSGGDVKSYVKQLNSGK